MKPLLILAALALAGCATRGPEAPVKVAVPVSCVPHDLAPAPSYPFSRADLLKAPGPDVLLKELYADYRLMAARLGEVEPVIASCR